MPEGTSGYGIDKQAWQYADPRRVSGSGKKPKPRSDKSPSKFPPVPHQKANS